MSSRRQFLQYAALAAAFPALQMPGGAFAAASLNSVKTLGKLRVGVTAADPWFAKDPMSGQWSGVCVEIGKKMATELGVAFEPVETTWGNSVAGIQANQIDVMFVLDPTEARKKAIDFPEAPLFYYAMGALVKDNTQVKTWEDLNKSGMRIGVTLGTNVDAQLTEKLKKAEIERFANNDEAIAAFAANRVDVVSQFHPALIVQYSRLKMGKVVLPEEVIAIPTSVGLIKSDDPSFRTWVNDYIDKLYSSGETSKIFESYLASKGIDPKTVPGLVKERWT
ncbi:transporter substrate-binding domain-containing protein [Rhizobium sp. NPDC090275]|uniref:transporter substrate-binding domain-containing protein n=1 Tax=Rhizobium sp. NPDC090275 TaxID=3364498 RepID=UPI00383B7A10